MITWEDHLRSHPAYVHTAIAASEVGQIQKNLGVKQRPTSLQIYVQLHDDPSLAKKNAASCEYRPSF